MKTIILSNKERFKMTYGNRKLISTIVITFAVFVMAMTPVNEEGLVKDAFYNAIVWVESKGSTTAKTKDGSLGIVQIRPVMVKEVNRICKIKGIDRQYKLTDRTDPEKSYEMFWIYQEFYHPDVNWASITIADMEMMAKRWNGGPTGEKKKSTKKYWRKVSKRLNEEFEKRNLASLM
jgi:hypothetical protein